jgi:hypothetical protein
MTLLELKTNSRAALDEATAALFTDVDILGWINEAERDIAAKTGCLEAVVTTLKTTNGSRLVAFTGNLVNDVEYAGGSLVHITPSRMGRIPLRGITTPQYWFQWGSYIVIEPKPDAAYDLVVYVSQSPSTEMSTNAHVPEIPLEFQEAIVPYVTMMGKLKAKKYADAAAKYGEYIIILQSLVDTYMRRIPAGLMDIRLPDATVVRQ